MDAMAADEHKRDAEFFTAMWESLCAEADSASIYAERRDSPRFPFHSVHLAASLDGDTVPPAEAFESVCCHDISCGGISFYAKHRPATQQVILIIQTENLRYCIEGHIVYCRPVYWNGDIQHIVGCKFRRRVDL